MVVFLAREALLLCRGNNGAVAKQGSGTIVIEGRNAEDVNGFYPVR